MVTLNGQGVSPGIAMGPIVQIETKGYKAPKYEINDAESEIERANVAISDTLAWLQACHEKALAENDADGAVIFEVQQMMLEDEDLLEAVRNKITIERKNAEFAVYAVGREYADRLRNTGDAYIAARAADVTDVALRVARELSGEAQNNAPKLSVPSIVAVDTLTPSMAAQIDKSKVLGFAVQYGSANSHAFILARSFGIPGVTALGEDYALVTGGMFALLDGDDGVLLLDPPQDVVDRYGTKLAEQQNAAAEGQAHAAMEAVTADGVRVEVRANIGSAQEAPTALANGAEGVGLFRSELLFMGGEIPTEEAQYLEYRKVLEAFQPWQVVVRTVDIGADKAVAALGLPRDQNPALGFRGVRLSLARRDIFMPQARALLRASAHGSLGVMLPMVTGPEEVAAARSVFDEAKAALEVEGCAVAEEIAFGVMIETPAAVVMADELAEMVDFFSIGTNDLTQYVYAADRMNDKTAHYFEGERVALLRMIQYVVDTAHRHGIKAVVCGESAAEIAMIRNYIGIGVDGLSVNARAVPATKERVRAENQTDARRDVEAKSGKA